MREASGVVWTTFREWYDSMLGLVTLNLLWLGLGLTLVLLPPATAGVYGVTNSLAHGKGQRLADFFATARHYAWLSIRWALLNGVVAAVFVFNFAFYGSTSTIAGMIIQVALGSAGIVWLGMQLYVWPFVFEQEDKRLRVALKNALYLTLAAPLYTLTLLGTVVLVSGVSLATVMPVAVFWIGFVSLLGNRAVIERLTAYGKLPAPSPASSPSEEDS